MKPWRNEQWCIPDVNPAFVAAMEDVLDLYAEAYDPLRPVVCLDEKPVVLHAGAHPSQPPAPGRIERRDYEYLRHGTANLFVVVEPLAGWRQVAPTPRRTQQDYVHQLRWSLDVAYPAAEQVRLVQDNLSTHGPAPLYATFPPAEARRLCRRLEFHQTPKHGSWLNMAEIEISIVARVPGSSRPRPANTAAADNRTHCRAQCPAAHDYVATHDGRRACYAAWSLSRHSQQHGLSTSTDGVEWKRYP